LQEFYVAQQRGDSGMADHYADTMGQFTEQDHGLRSGYGESSADGARRNQGMLGDLSWLQTEPPPSLHRVSATPRSAISPSQHGQQLSLQHIQQHLTAMSPLRQVSQHVAHQSPQQDSLGFSFAHNMDMSSNPSHNDILGAASILTQPFSNQQSGYHQSMLPDGNTTNSIPEAIQSSSPVINFSAGGNIHHDGISPHQPTGFFNFTPGLVAATPPVQDMSNTRQRTSSPQVLEPFSRAEEPADANVRLYHFGSDNHFHSNGFIPASEHDRHEVRAEFLTEELRRLKPINRDEGDITREPTPELVQGKKRKLSAITIGPSPTDREGSRDDKGKAKSPVRKTMGKARGLTARRHSQADVHSTKRRRSSLSGPKPALRDHLTEQQKRSNHIQSEQKRRTAIAQGFSALHDLVPELIVQGGGLSKSNVLIEAVNFLESLHRNNAEMKRRLGTQ
jgi:hypothetical protein